MKRKDNNIVLCPWKISWQGDKSSKTLEFWSLNSVWTLNLFSMRNARPRHLDTIQLIFCCEVVHLLRKIKSKQRTGECGIGHSEGHGGCIYWGKQGGTKKRKTGGFCCLQLHFHILFKHIFWALLVIWMLSLLLTSFLAEKVRYWNACFSGLLSHCGLSFLP